MKAIIRTLLFVVVLVTPRLILEEDSVGVTPVTRSTAIASRASMEVPVEFITVGARTDSKQKAAKRPAKNILALVILDLARS